MRHPPWLFWLCVILLAAAACEGPAMKAPARGMVSSAPADLGDLPLMSFRYQAAEESPPATPEPSLVPMTRAADGGEPAMDLGATLGIADRLLIYRGQVQVEVARPGEVMDEFLARVAEWGGHLQSQQDRTLVVRVPAIHFEEAFTWVRNAGRLLAESRQSDDITEEFVDLGIRIDNAQKARARLLEVLQKADKVEDILKVEAELRRLTEELERMEGRRKLLADQVAFSTLAATFQPTNEAPIARPSRQPSRFEWINRIGAERVMEDF